jgi:hypothetical protein
MLLFHFQVQLGKQACLGGGQGTLGWGGKMGVQVLQCQSFVPSTRKQTVVSKKTPKCLLMMLHKIFLPPNLNIKRELSSVNHECLVKKSIL